MAGDWLALRAEITTVANTAATISIQARVMDRRSLVHSIADQYTGRQRHEAEGRCTPGLAMRCAPTELLNMLLAEGISL